jgi:tetratricopeptide (TPR) repeat protein
VDYSALFERILGQVDQAAYMPLADVVDPAQLGAMAEIEAQIRAPATPAHVTESLIRRDHKDGRIDRVHMLSALHVLAASPKVGDFDLAARHAAEQEMAALAQGGARLAANLASVDRHRGVLAFLQGHFAVALDYFSRAFERQHTAGNLANVLATLIRLGDIDESQALLAQVRRGFSPNLVSDLNQMIASDPDLALLRGEDTPC